MSDLEFESLNKSSIKYLKPAELADYELIGTYEGTVQGKFGPNHNFKTQNGETVVVNGCGSLNKGLERANEGDLIRLVYLGKKKITDGPMKGKDAHSVDVQRVKR